MRLTTYRDADGALQMMSDETCLLVIRRVGRSFIEGLEKIEKAPSAPRSELMDGIAAYIMLKLEGENAAVDAAYRRCIKMVTDAAFELAKETV